MESFYEIMDFCGFDLEKANAMAKNYEPWMKDAAEEALQKVGLEKISAESLL